jgi:hypothetical protein
MRTHTKEMHGMRETSRTRVRGGVLLAAMAVLPLAACDTLDDLIRAENPAAIAETELDEPTLANVLVNSVVGSLAAMYDDPFIWRGSMLTDEQVTGINWEATARVNERRLRYDQETTMFPAISRYRFMGDSISARLRNLLPNAASDRRLALTLAHSGYGYTLLGETMCEATINVGAERLTPQQLFEMAIPRFEEAIQIATRANAQQELNLARVGLARAALNAGQREKAMNAARDVPASFNHWVEYLQGTMSNTMHANITGANHNLGVHPRFLNGTFGQVTPHALQTDPRIQHDHRVRTGHNGLSILYTPRASIPYSTYNGRTAAQAGGTTGANAPALYDQSTNIKLASWLEAMHHYYEAAGPDGTGPRGTTLQFVNERRAYGNQPAVTLTGAALMSELREQRARDMYLGGFRLGDLRRWERQGINDPRHSFPTDPHPVAGWSYGDATCFPLPIQEFVGNPNIRR